MSVAEESEADDDPVVSIAAEALRHSSPSRAAVAVKSAAAAAEKCPRELSYLSFYLPAGSATPKRARAG